LKSCTGDITEFKVQGPDGRNITFVDTPGFDDTYKSDVEILAQVAEWLLNAWVYYLSRFKRILIVL